MNVNGEKSKDIYITLYILKRLMKTDELMRDWRVIALIAVAVILIRTAISIDRTITYRESVCSGVVIILLGWLIFTYLYSLSRSETSWLISNKMAQGLAITTFALNIYALIYYGMRWYQLLKAGGTALFVPHEFFLRDVRYAMLVLAYSGIIWATGYLRKMHDNYLLVTERMPEMRKGGVSESIFRIITDERTVIVLLGLVFLWRSVISFDKQIVLWESMVSGMALIILGWVLFGYISSLAVRTTRPSVARIYQGIASAIFAVNMYTLFYYGMRWYTLIYKPEVEKTLLPLDFVFRDIRYFMLTIFFCTAIVLSKYLERASEECEYLIKKGEERYKE